MVQMAIDCEKLGSSAAESLPGGPLAAGGAAHKASLPLKHKHPFYCFTVESFRMARAPSLQVQTGQAAA